MAGWHIYDEALQFASSHPLKGLSHDFMVPTRNEPGPHQLHKIEIAVLSGFPLLGFIQQTKKPENLRLLIFWDLLNQFRVIHELIIWCRVQDSNPRPSVYNTAAQPTELTRLKVEQIIHDLDVLGI